MRSPAAAANADAVAPPLADAPDALTALPCALLSVLLRCVVAACGSEADCGARELVRLAACCRRLHAAVADADVLWKALCAARGWSQPPALSPPLSWQAVFRSRRGTLCVECRTPTPYIFPLISPTFRLCARCEPGSPRYALLTAAQAVDGFGLSAEQLAQLPCREVRGLRSRAVEKRLRMLGQATLYLRSHVVALAEQLQRDAADSDGEDAAGDGSDDEDGAERVADEGGGEESEQFRLDEEEDCAGGTPTPATAHGRNARRSAEEAKAARKANKAAVKAANRERRAAKSAGAAAGSSPAGSGEVRKSYALLSQSPGNGVAAFGGSPGTRRAAAAMSASPPWQGSAPSTPPFGAAQQQRRGGKAAHARDAARAAAAGASPTSAGPLSRAWLEDELGVFGISGLELAA